MSRLGRLLRPDSVAVIGGGAWCANIMRECERIGFAGDIWPVHPTRTEVGGRPAFASVDDLPRAPDAAFVGVNRNATIDVVTALAARGAGGAVCFASGFREAEAELGGEGDLQADLVAAAGEMPILGPNCYGFINALDGAALWPDHHGAGRVERGVAIVTQSSNIAINLTMQRRGLPIAYVVTAGNQAQTGLAGIARALLEDPRVTALGLYIEGIGDLRAFEAMADAAREMGKPVVALKVGASHQARLAAVSHTASLTGSEAGAHALLERLGIGRVTSPAALIETLKLLHVAGPLASNRIASMSCSGGEASLVADSALGLDLEFPPLTPAQAEGLRGALGPKVALANPLDYHTYIWGDRAALTRCFSAMMVPDLAMGCVVLDFPRGDLGPVDEWSLVVDAVAEAKRETGRPMAIISSLAETMPEDAATAMMARGIVPLSGLTEGLEAIAVAARLGAAQPGRAPVTPPNHAKACRELTEAEGKAFLTRYGADVPQSRQAETPEAAAQAAGEIGFPVVLKGEGAAHKTEAGLIALGLRDAAAVEEAARAMPANRFLVEEMVDGGVAELIAGVVCDPAHGFVLTLGAGGTLTEILRDTAVLLVPATEADIDAALDSLKIAPLLAGYRGAPGANRAAIRQAVVALQTAIVENAGTMVEIEINPLICTPTRAAAADALIRLGDLK